MPRQGRTPSGVKLARRTSCLVLVFPFSLFVEECDDLMMKLRRHPINYTSDLLKS